MYITQYWHLAQTTPEVERSVESFRKHNPGMRHQLFDEETAENFISTHFSGREVAAFRSCAVPAMQSDYFRYCAVLIRGGIYSDIGCTCWRPLDPLVDSTKEGLFFKWMNSVINGQFFVRMPQHPFIRLTLEIATQSIERRLSNRVWLVTGPAIFTFLMEVARSESVESYAQEVLTHADKDEEFRAHLSLLGKDVLRGDDALVAGICDGFKFAQLDLAFKYLRPMDLPHRKNETHWLNWKGSIFR